MNLTEALDLARRWEKKAATINGSLFTNSQELQIKFAGRVSVYEDGLVIKAENGCEVALTLLPEMTIRYGEAILEIRALGWRCILSEPKT